MFDRIYTVIRDRLVMNEYSQSISSVKFYSYTPIYARVAESGQTRWT